MSQDRKKSKLPFQPEDLAVWSAESLKHDVHEEFEFGYGLDPTASMLQAVMGQNGPVLVAASAVCLLIPVYVLKHKLGLLIHLWRDEDLSEEAADVIRCPFEAYPELAEQPIVGFVSSASVAKDFPKQVSAARELIRGLAPSAILHDVAVAGPEGSTDDADEDLMDVEVYLDTRQGKLRVLDFNHAATVLDYRDFKV